MNMVVFKKEKILHSQKEPNQLFRNAKLSLQELYLTGLSLQK